jgi:hypothetical protein
MPVFTLPAQNYPPGEQIFGPVAVPQGLLGCVIILASCTSATPTIWPNAGSRVDISLDCSYNGGQSYQLGQFKWGQGGGIFLDKNGNERPTRVIRFDAIPPPTHVRWTITISGGPVRTSGTLTTL